MRVGGTADRLHALQPRLGERDEQHLVFVDGGGDTGGGGETGGDGGVPGRSMMSYRRERKRTKSVVDTRTKNTDNCFRYPKSSQVRATLRSLFGFEMS